MNKGFGVFLALRRVTVVALSLVSLNAAWATQRPISREANEALIRNLHSQMIEAYNRGDAAGAASTFAPEGTLITGDATRYVTPLEIERYLSRLLAKLPQGTRFIATVTDVRFVWSRYGGAYIGRWLVISGGDRRL
jgi:uncharacterized protein (TIGR02246 family)